MPQAKAPAGENLRLLVNSITDPYWQGTRDGQLRAAACRKCGRYRMPYLPFCANCNAQTVTWHDLKGPAKVYSFTFYPHPDRRDGEDTMLAPVIVEFDEAPGIRYAGNLDDIAVEDVHIGMSLAVGWTHNKDGWGFPTFRPLAQD
jgi:uncharacterized OB-fold protein